MKVLLVLAAALVALIASPVAAANWGVLVAGSNGYGNYRHQADIAHAFHIMKNNGIPESNIITFVFDDIAANSRNPYPGQVFNAPTPAGVAGVNVWEGMKKDYTGADVTPANFLAVLTGDSSKVPSGKPVLKSTSSDNVFVFFSDHGSPGLIAFPSKYLYAADMMAALRTMYEKKNYNKLVFYLETCESGSMFDGLLPNNWNMYATTAANPREPSWGGYCPPQDKVNGKSIGSCLGDVYSTNWMETAEQLGTQQTLQEHYLAIKNLTKQSHVMQYGDLSFTGEPISNFLGKSKALKKAAPRQEENPFFVSSRDVPMHLAYYRYLRAPQFSEEAREAMAELRQQLDSREAAEIRFTKLASLLAKDPAFGQNSHITAAHLFESVKGAAPTGECVRTAVEGLKALGCDYDDYSLKFHNVIANYCRHHENDAHASAYIAEAVKEVCVA